MLKVLVKKQIAEIFRSYVYNAKKNKAYSKGTTIAYFAFFVLLMVGILGGMFTFLSLVLCAPMHEAGKAWLYFAMMGLLSILLGAFGSVFNTYSSLYLPKDNDLLLSMPIPVHTLMAARLLSVYLMGLMYSATVLLPAILVYWVTVSISVKAILGGLIFLLMISLFVMTLSCALGWVVAKISIKLKNKSLITVFISLVFFAGYYFVYFKAQSLIGELIQNVALYGNKIQASAYPVYVFGLAGTGDWKAVLAVTAVTLVLFALMWFLLSRSFLKIATTSGSVSRRVYHEKAAKQESASAALLKKEFSHFISSPNYILNCGLGTLLLFIGGIAFAWKGSTIVPVLDEIFSEKPGAVQLLLCAAVFMVISMNDMAAPSVSLEGKSLWLLQSLPVSPWQILRSKLAVQLLLTGIPAVFCVGCMSVSCFRSPVQILAALVFVLSFVLLLTMFDMFLGLKMANLNWTNELVPIKQSGCVGLALLGGFVYSILPAMLFLLTGGGNFGFAPYATAFSVVTLGLCAVLYGWLKKKGSALFATL